MATLEEFVTQVTTEVEAEKPLTMANGNETVEFTDDDYNWTINVRANELFWQQENGWKIARIDAYGDIGDQLDMMYADLLNDTTTWADHVAQVKADNPKPS